MCSSIKSQTCTENKYDLLADRRGEPTTAGRELAGACRFDPGQPWVQQLLGTVDANPWCQTLPSGTGFEAVQVSLMSCEVPMHRG